MTNLLISGNNPTLPAKGTPGDATLPRSDPFAASGNAASTSKTNSATNDQAAEPFSALLKRQIGESWETGLDSRKLSTATDGKAAEDAAAAAKNTQDQIIANAGITSDQAGSLAAMMLQIPVADRGQSNGSQLAAGNGGKELRIENDVRQSSGRPAEKDSALTKTDHTDSASLLNADAVKHVGMAVSSAAHPGTIQDNTKATIAGAATAGMHNIITSNTPANIAQTVTAPVGSNGWAGEFSQKIVWISNQQNHSAELHLNPPDLGPLNVVIKMSDNQLTAQFTSPHSAVRDAVENALPKLREILADNNIMLGNATVSDQPPRDRSGEGDMNRGSGNSAQRETSYNATESNELLPVTGQNVPARRHNGMLDTFA